MVGVGLGHLWDTNPRIAFVFHLAITVMLGGFALSFIWSGKDWVVALILAIAFVVMAAILVFFTWLAVQDPWQRTDQ
jgi:peptidoglycan/LPS O-acetylase OafA/YrhL